VSAVSTPGSPAVSAVPSGKPRVHIGYLDGLRALAAMFVVLHHSSTQFDLTHAPAPFAELLKFFSYGHYAVDIFIVLSGFCLMLPVALGDGTMRGSAASFFLKRARRILPPYYLALAFSLILIYFFLSHASGTRWDSTLPITKQGVLLHLFLLQDVAGNFEINYPLWSIPVEWRIYFLFPVLVWAFRRYSPVAVTSVTVIASYIVWIGIDHSPLHRWISTYPSGVSPYYLGLFAMGMLATKAAYSGDRSRAFGRPASAWAAATAVSAFVVFALSAFPLAHGHSLPPQVMSLFVGLFSMILLIWVSISPRSWAGRLFAWRPLVFLGTFAYSLYLTHAPLVQLFWQYVIHPLHLSDLAGFAMAIFVGAPLITGVAYLFHLACERPFMNTKPRPTVAETERDAVLSPAP
jgi:peptidoglycan/LPS O-acetylase OafA/YrhL